MGDNLNRLEPSPWVLTVLTSAIVAGFVAVALTGLSLGMDQTVHLRYTAHALPAVLSWMFLGLPLDFSAYEGVQSFLVSTAPSLTSADTWDSALARVAEGDLGQGLGGLVFFPFDDKGYALLTALGFQLFGLSISSIYWAWMLIFGLSVACGWILMRKRIDGLVVLCCTVLGLWATLFALPVSSELREITNPRAVGMLGLVAFVTLLYVVVADVKLSASGLVAVVIESAIVLFAYLSRSSEIWQAAVLVSVSVGLLIWRRLRGPTRAALNPAAAVIGGVAICAIAVQVFSTVVLHPAYATNYGNGRLIWHNLGVGFAENPAFRPELGAEVSDTIMFTAVEGLAVERGIRDEVFLRPDELPILQNPIRNFLKYEDLAREVVMGLVAEHPSEAAATFLYWKPLRLVEELRRAVSPSYQSGQSSEYGWASEDQRIASSWSFNVFRPLGVFVCILVVGCLIALRPRLPNGRMLATMAVVLVGSVVPSILAYPAYHTVGTFLATLGASFYLGGILACYGLVQWGLRQRARRAAEAAAVAGER